MCVCVCVVVCVCVHVCVCVCVYVCVCVCVCVVVGVGRCEYPPALTHFIHILYPHTSMAPTYFTHTLHTLQ